MSIEDDEIGELKHLIHELLAEVRDAEDLGGNFIEQLSARFDDSRAKKFSAFPLGIKWEHQSFRSPIKWLNQKVVCINFWSAPIDRMTQAVVDALHTSGAISLSQAQIFLRHTLVFTADGVLRLARPSRTEMYSAAISLFFTLLITMAVTAIIISQIHSIFLAEVLALPFGLMMGRLGRHAFDLFWGREELVRIIHRKYPWIPVVHS